MHLNQRACSSIAYALTGPFKAATKSMLISSVIASVTLWKGETVMMTQMHIAVACADMQRSSVGLVVGGGQHPGRQASCRPALHLERLHIQHHAQSGML